MCNLRKLLRGWSSGEYPLTISQAGICSCVLVSQVAHTRSGSAAGSQTAESSVAREDKIKEGKTVKEMTAFSGGAETIQALPAVWQGQQGRKRVTGEFLYLKSIELPWVYDLQVRPKLICYR